MKNTNNANYKGGNNFLNKIGRRYGKLLVINIYRRDNINPIIWECQCDCGKIKLVNSSDLRNNLKKSVRSCGCLYKNNGGSNKIDLKDKIFGRWKVIELIGKTKNGNCVWKCKCNCGKIKNVRASNLINGKSKSCDCFRIEKVKSNCKEKSVFWNHNLSNDERQLIRTYLPENHQWRIKVFKRDNYTCQKCKIHSGCGYHIKLIAHHLNGYHWDKENRFNPDNGVCLCEKCHENFHEKYKRKNNTKEQFLEWIKLPIKS